jgi:LacI family transcriptional regulator
MSNDLIEQLRRDVPLVVVNRLIEGLPSVVMDVARGARVAIEHLVRLGHRDIALVCGPRGSWTNREIRRSAAATARTLGAALTILGPNAPTEAAGAAAADTVRRSGATAVLAYNDLMAIGLLEALQTTGTPVPAELSVIGIDNIELSRFVRPKLTTVATPTAAAGRAAVDMLLQHGDDRRTTAQVTLQTELVVRDSTGPGPYAEPELAGAVATARRLLPERQARRLQPERQE